MTMRVGLQPKSRLVKKALTCPVGEQIINGGYELGNLTGWSWSGSYPPVVGVIEKHSGVYGCEIPAPCTMQNSTNLRLKTQCIDELYLWAKKKHYDTGYVLKLRWFIYSWTGSVAWGDYIFTANDTWEKIDLYSAVKNANTIIRLIVLYDYGTHIAGNTIFIDDISLLTSN